MDKGIDVSSMLHSHLDFRNLVDDNEVEYGESLVRATSLVVIDPP